MYKIYVHTNDDMIAWIYHYSHCYGQTHSCKLLKLLSCLSNLPLICNTCGITEVLKSLRNSYVKA